ncbi:MAG: N-acetylneuraminate synthase [Proteobacteria bacterium]|nr:N-acetylneuraminate synthase [Pseudomonadota bacterium]
MSDSNTTTPNRTFIIAEAGVNHNGRLDLAKKLVDAAADAGADAVKFQTFKAEKLVASGAPKARYQQDRTSAGETQLEMIRKLELSQKGHKELAAYCEEKNILFLSSPFDLESIDFLSALGMTVFKIPSGEITNLVYLRKIGGLKKKVILSTGMANLGEIEKALGILTGAGTERDNITVLHCNTEYPTPMKDVNLKAMLTLKTAFGVRTGYSDHTLGIEVPVAAVALGASVIEKHFTLDKTMEGPDHPASLEPEELKNMVRAIRHIEMALGDGVKKPSLSEIPNMIVARKSIVAAKKISKGDMFSNDNLTVKRPGSGISPMQWDDIIGRQAIRNFIEDELIEI